MKKFNKEELQKAIASILMERSISSAAGDKYYHSPSPHHYQRSRATYRNTYMPSSTVPSRYDEMEAKIVSHLLSRSTQGVSKLDSRPSYDLWDIIMYRVLENLVSRIADRVSSKIAFKTPDNYRSYLSRHPFDNMASDIASVFGRGQTVDFANEIASKILSFMNEKKEGEELSSVTDKKISKKDLPKQGE